MTTKHTPGPWRYVQNQIRAKSGQKIGGVEISEMVCMMPHGPKYPGHDANAHLIAAAPDMLEALLLAEATIERLDKMGSAVGTLDVVAAAIKKAKGEL
jgi:hypothetical protein